MVRRTRPGTSRFRVRCYASPRNDGWESAAFAPPLCQLMRSVCILPKFKSGNGAIVHLVRTVCQTERTDMGIILCQAGLVGDTAAAIGLDRIVDDLQRHVGSRDLDHRDLGLRGLVTDLV